MYFNHKQAVLVAALNFLNLLAPLSRIILLRRIYKNKSHMWGVQRFSLCEL